MERTQSIMRIATTASPISGDAVREQMQLLRTRATYLNAVNLIKDRWASKQNQRLKQLRRQYSARASLMSDLSGSSNSLSMLSTKNPGVLSPLRSEKRVTVSATARSALDTSMDSLTSESDHHFYGTKLD